MHIAYRLLRGRPSSRRFTARAASRSSRRTCSSPRPTWGEPSPRKRNAGSLRRLHTQLRARDKKTGRVESRFFLAFFQNETEKNRRLGRFPQAEEFLSLTNWSILKNPDCSNNLRSQLHRNLGKLYSAQGKLDHAANPALLSSDSLKSCRERERKRETARSGARRALEGHLLLESRGRSGTRRHASASRAPRELATNNDDEGK